MVENRSEEEYVIRERLIEHIEGRVGIWAAVWNDWPTDQIEKLSEYIKAVSKRTVTSA